MDSDRLRPATVDGADDGVKSHANTNNILVGHAVFKQEEDSRERRGEDEDRSRGRAATTVSLLPSRIHTLSFPSSNMKFALPKSRWKNIRISPSGACTLGF